MTGCSQDNEWTLSGVCCPVCYIVFCQGRLTMSNMGKFGTFLSLVTPASNTYLLILFKKMHCQHRTHRLQYTPPPTHPPPPNCSQVPRRNMNSSAYQAPELQCLAVKRCGEEDEREGGGEG